MMAILNCVHMAWTWCIIGNPCEAGYPSHMYIMCRGLYVYIYIIREEASIFAPQRLRFYRALGVAACTVGKVRASTVFMCVCSMFRPSDFLLLVKNGFAVGVRCQGNREPPVDGATTPLSQRHAWLALPKQ